MKCWNGFNMFCLVVFNLSHVGYDTMLRALGLYTLERRKESDDLMQTFKIIKCLAGIRDHRGSLFQIKRNDTLRVNWKTTVQEQVTTGLRS